MRAQARADALDASSFHETNISDCQEREPSFQRLSSSTSLSDILARARALECRILQGRQAGSFDTTPRVSVSEGETLAQMSSPLQTASLSFGSRLRTTRG